MAFDLKYFLPLSAMANSNVPRVFLYKDDTDTLATIATADYFLSQKIALKVGDIIRVFPAAQVNSIDLVVTASSATTVTVAVGAGGTADLTATNSIVASQSGGTFFLNSATEFVTTLPLPAPGLKFRFVIKAAPASASYTIVTASSTNLIVGCISSADLNAANDTTGANATPADTITFTDSAAVIGDWCELISDGTKWYVSGCCAAVTGIVLSVAS